MLEGSTQVSFSRLLDGYLAAEERFRIAAREQDSNAAFRPLFEALNWAVALDDYCGERWVPEGKTLGFAWRERVNGGEILAGVRYARNRVHHQWADALDISEGLRFPFTFPMVFFEWVWRPAADLPPPPTRYSDSGGEKAYEEMLAGQAVRHTLQALVPVFEFVRGLLDVRIVNRAVDASQSKAR